MHVYTHSRTHRHTTAISVLCSFSRLSALSPATLLFYTFFSRRRNLLPNVLETMLWQDCGGRIWKRELVSRELACLRTTLVMTMTTGVDDDDCDEKKKE